jgi:beta-N-acetylhexosaminidase
VERDDLFRHASATLLPAIGSLTLDARMEDFLRGGGRAVLLGEDRDEYVARRMAEQRVAAETCDDVEAATAAIRQLAGAPALVAVDEELGGIERFAHLAGTLPSALDAAGMDPDHLAEACAEVGGRLRALGVTMTLAPILDVIDSENPWLYRRHLGPEPEIVARVAVAYVRGMEQAGVRTTAKHFPGHRGVTTDPAVQRSALIPGDAAQVRADLEPFRAACAAGVSCVMIGPGTSAALDASQPAILSPAVIAVLRQDLAFDGLVVSDDLDAAAVLGRRTVPEVACAALAAGNDLLLVSAENDLAELAEGIVVAVEQERLPEERLLAAAGRVAACADSTAGAQVPDPGR